MKAGARVLFALLLAGAPACHHAGTGTAPQADAARVEVTNHWELPMEVYVEAAGTRHRLGLVSPGIDRSFALPHALLMAGGRVEFFAAPSAGGASARSGELVIGPGDVVDFEITSQLFDSRATIRHRY